jgi:hypothetical protein
MIMVSLKKLAEGVSWFIAIRFEDFFITVNKGCEHPFAVLFILLKPVGNKRRPLGKRLCN